jgi:hypothetical protein
VTPDLDRLLTDDLCHEIERRSLGELRDLRRSVQKWEAAVSLTRRLAQGRLDILGYELRRRSRAGEGPVDSHLLFDLPDILAESPSPGGGRMVAVEGPGPAADVLAGVLDEVVEPSALGRPEQLADHELPMLFERLTGLERSLSEARRALHERLDVLQAEIGRRYRDGEASIDSLLDR